jgi:DedD protein
MGFLSIFQRKADASPPAAATQKPSIDSADDVMRARVRARQRLIGAAVLVVIGIVGFPLVFETQPRPIPVDIPIEIPRKDGAPALTMPPARAPRPAASTDAAPAPKDDVITESRDDAGKPVAPAASAPAQVAAAVPPKPVDTKPAEAKPAAPESKPEPKPDAKPAKPAPSSDSTRAKALLEGKDVAAKPEPKPDTKETKADAGRFVVQVGAFADASAARETRLKVEKLGLKTYTQVAATANGNRIRVRVGPFASRDEADKALAKAKSAGLTAVVLTL